jgi:DNA polymerase-1
MGLRDTYRTVVAVDFEFEFGGHDTFKAASQSGERPRPVCMVAKDLVGGQEWRLWRGEFDTVPPFPIGPDVLFIAYYASAELGCFRALGWPNPPMSSICLLSFVTLQMACKHQPAPAWSGR